MGESTIARRVKAAAQLQDWAVDSAGIAGTRAWPDGWPLAAHTSRRPRCKDDGRRLHRSPLHKGDISRRSTAMAVSLLILGKAPEQPVTGKVRRGTWLYLNCMTLPYH